MADPFPPPPPPGAPPGSSSSGASGASGALGSAAPAPAWPAPPGAGPDATGRGPRPRVTVPALLLLGGAVVMVIGTFLPWISGGGESVNGWDLADLSGESSDAGVFVGLAVVLAGFGIALAAAGRVLAVAILAVVVAAFAVLAAFIDVTDDEGLDAFGLEIGAGLYVILLAALVTLGGAIWALATRRR